MKANPKKFKLIAIGASTGGFSALPLVLIPLPDNFPLPIVVIQHKSETDFDNFTAQYLKEKCKLPVREADQLEPVNDGTIYLAPGGYHLYIEYDKTFSLSLDDRVNFSRPSIDVFFESAAKVYSSGLIGLMLTGANCDGTLGMISIKEAGGYNLAQDPATAEAKEMPQSVIKAGVVDEVLPLEKMAGRLMVLAGLGRRQDSLKMKRL